MKTITFILLFASLTMSSACGNKKEIEKKEEVVVVDNNDSEQKPSSQITARLADMNQEFKSDNFTILDVHIDGNLMHLTVGYSGGCGEHKFDVVGSEMIMKSLPPQRPVLILHDAGGDKCRALITEQLTVDISAFAYQQEEGSEIMLVMEGREKISYKYSAE